MKVKEVTIKLFINGKTITVESEKPTVVSALQCYLTSDEQQQTFAVALNGDFVGKADYQRTLINQGDNIDVLFPIQGG